MCLEVYICSRSNILVYLVTSSDSVEGCRRSLVLCPSDEIILAHIVFSCSSGQCADKPRDPGLVSLGPEGLLCIGGEDGGGGVCVCLGNLWTTFQ